MKLPSLVLSVLLASPGDFAVAERQGKDEKGRVDCRLIMNQGLRECQGDDPTILIVGGVEVSPANLYPWFVSFSRGACGGSLISRQYVLTAAHCLPTLTGTTKALIGRFNKDYDNGGQPLEVLTVAKRVMHPDFNSQTINFDFALLKLVSTSTVDPVKLDGDGGEDLVANYGDTKTGLWPIGFGALSFNGPMTNVLRHVDVDFVPQAKCKLVMDPFLTDTMLCAADVGQTSCDGDSGGPLWDKEAGTQVGVVSWGYECALPYPGVFSRISAVFPWIRATVCEGTDKPGDDPFCGGYTNPPTPAPTKKPDCMSGSTMVTKFHEKEDSSDMVVVRDLKNGDQIKGLDEEKEEAVCTVVSIFESGRGQFYGNYTAGHYVYDKEDGTIVTHDKEGEMTTDDMYDVITDCPLGVDESGVGFTGISRNLCKGKMSKLSWKDYINLHRGLLRLIVATGIHDYSAFRSVGKARKHLGGVCNAMIKCIKASGKKNEGRKCRALERKSKVFYDKVLTKKAKRSIAKKIKATVTAAGASFPEVGDGAITNVVARGLFQ